MTAAPRYYHVAVPSPLYRHFDYLPPRESTGVLAPGTRVRVPFGPRREVTGVILAGVDDSALARERLKPILRVLDPEPILPPSLLALLEWVADYYHHPLGDVLATALPVWLRQGRPARIAGAPFWTLSAAGRALDPAAIKRAPSQRRMIEALASSAQGLGASELERLSPRWRAAITALVRRGLVTERARDCLKVSAIARDAPPPLNAAQRAAVSAIEASLGSYQCHLLHGVTGSGKTEVYLGAIQAALARGGQALVLVPEIGLTPQLVERFERRLGVPVAVLHSALTDTERACAWLAAAEGRVSLILGTRSAVFTPMPQLALIVVDEEHDGSYKQQDGLRYSARDVAVMRAARERVPVVLGSATPSLESLKNARDGGYRLAELPDRTGGAGMPDVEILDVRRLALDEGLSHPLRVALAQCLTRGEQSLLFINRRGFAPAWMCHACGWVAPCARCDARLTYHQGRGKLICHHCGHEQHAVETCPSCQAAGPKPLGQGTERIEQALARLFPHARAVRLDRDTTRAKGSLEERLARIRAGEAEILVGTQMLSKGHDFPNVTLVGIVNADQGLYSADFRAEERLFQQILQVAGRAGRADKPGRVLIQTWHPEHPLFAALVRHDFAGFAEQQLSERREAAYPPYQHLAVLRAESPKAGAALAFLAHARQLAGRPEGVTLLDPLPAPMERRQGRWRAQLLVQAASRKPLHVFLDGWVQTLAGSKPAKQVRWSLDVDPIDLY